MEQNPLGYLQNKSKKSWQFIVPEEKTTDCMATHGGGTAFFWQKDKSDSAQQWLFVQIGGPNSTTHVIVDRVSGGLLTWFGGVASAKALGTFPASEFGEPQYFWEIYKISGEEENATYHIIHKQTGDYLARIGCGSLSQPDLRCATLWAASGGKEQIFRIQNAEAIDGVPDISKDVTSPIDYIYENCQIKSWEHNVPQEIPEAVVGESLVPFFLVDGDSKLRFQKGPYYKMQRAQKAHQSRQMTKIDGDSSFKLDLTNHVTQTTHSMKEIMEDLHVGVKGGVDAKGVNLGADFSYDLHIGQSEGWKQEDGSSSSEVREWPVGYKIRIGYWDITDTFRVLDSQGHVINKTSSAFKEVTIWDES